VGEWYESRIDRQIREAQERGDFDNLPGAGKPLPDRGELYDEEWWLKDLVRREKLSGLAPTSLRLRKEVEDLAARLAAEWDEAVVRQIVADLNERIERARRGLVDGPPVAIAVLDVEAVVQAWRADRQA
jgi:Domain of unknown function (DUF1992)